MSVSPLLHVLLQRVHQALECCQGCLVPSTFHVLPHMTQNSHALRLCSGTKQERRMSTAICTMSDNGTYSNYSSAECSVTSHQQQEASRLGLVSLRHTVRQCVSRSQHITGMLARTRHTGTTAGTWMLEPHLESQVQSRSQCVLCNASQSYYGRALATAIIAAPATASLAAAAACSRSRHLLA